MDYTLFLDESGDHGLKYIDKNFPLFLLCGVLINNDELAQLEEQINNFKLKYFTSTEVVLHSRDIRKCQDAFQILFDLDVKKSFYEEINLIMKNSDYTLIGAAVNKEEHIKKYGKNAGNPYSLSLSFIIERSIFCLDNIDRDGRVSILAEERGSKVEDKQLLAYFNSVRDNGTYYVDTERLKAKIRHLAFYNKRENVIGLQIADLCAYPIARHVLNPKSPNPSFEIIKSKLYKGSDGQYKGWGLKVFP